MRSIAELDGLIKEQNKKCEESGELLKTAQNNREKALAEYEKAKRENSGEIEKTENLSKKNTTALFAAVSLIITAAVLFLLLKLPFLSSVTNGAKAAFTGPYGSAYKPFFAVAAALFAVTLVLFICGAGKKLKIASAVVSAAAFLALIGSNSGVGMLLLFVIAFSVVLNLILKLVRKAVFKADAGRANIYVLLHGKKRADSAKLNISLAEKKYLAADSKCKQAEKEADAAKDALTALQNEKTGVLSRDTAKKAAADYPANAVFAYAAFVNAFALTGEMDDEFFALRAKMEKDTPEQMYNFALGLLANNIDGSEFLRLLQLSLNAGYTPAKAAYGKVLSQISAAAGSGNYAAAYAMLTPLIEAGSAEALTIKLQLDDNKAAADTRIRAEKTRKAAEDYAKKQMADINYSHRQILGEMKAMHDFQKFADFSLNLQLNDIASNGVKIKTPLFDW